MTSAQGSGQGFGFTIGVAALAIGLTVVVAILASSWTAGPSPTATGGATSAVVSAAPTARVDCREDPGPLALGLAGPACPMAILAVELAVAPVRLPIERIAIQPGPFYCDVIWPGVQSVPICRGYAVQPGQFMHAWVSFANSPKVAVVALGLDLPEEVRVPGRTRPPWQTTLVTVEIPPDGWVMP